MWYTKTMHKDTCLIYEGEFYRVEWYFNDKGISQAYEYFLSEKSTALKSMAAYKKAVDEKNMNGKGK